MGTWQIDLVDQLIPLHCVESPRFVGLNFSEMLNSLRIEDVLKALTHVDVDHIVLKMKLGRNIFMVAHQSHGNSVLLITCNILVFLIIQITCLRLCILQMVFYCTYQTVLITLFARFVILHKKPSLRKTISAIMVFCAELVALIPDIFPKLENDSSKSDDGGASGIAGILWPLCYFAGFVSTGNT